MSKPYNDASKLADEIEATDGLVMMTRDGPVQLGIRKTAMVVATLRAGLAESAPSTADAIKMADRLDDVLVGKDGYIFIRGSDRDAIVKLLRHSQRRSQSGTISKEWCLKMAEHEAAAGDPEISAGTSQSGTNTRRIPDGGLEGNWMPPGGREDKS